MDLKIKIDAAEISKNFKEFAAEVENDLKKGVANLATVTHAKVAEMASSELKTSRKTFMEGLKFEEVSEGVWVVSIDEKSLWVEEGIQANFDMKPGLLREGEISKRGNYKYKVVPYEHSKPPSQLTPTAQSIVSQIKTNLKKENIPFKTIEKNSDGSPKVGKLHNLSWPSAKPGKGTAPALKNVSIYQTVTKTGNVRRDIMTFRTVTGGPASEGKWIHPGFTGKKFLDKAYDWALKEWEEKILPEILNKWR